MRICETKTLTPLIRDPELLCGKKYWLNISSCYCEKIFWQNTKITLVAVWIFCLACVLVAIKVNPK